MKVTIDKATIAQLVTVCSWRSRCTFSNVLMRSLCDSELEKLQVKCAGKRHQKKATIEVSTAQAVALSLVLQAQQQEPLSFVILEYVINPIINQLQ